MRGSVAVEPLVRMEVLVEHPICDVLANLTVVIDSHHSDIYLT